MHTVGTLPGICIEHLQTRKNGFGQKLNAESAIGLNAHRQQTAERTNTACRETVACIIIQSAHLTEVAEWEKCNARHRRSVEGESQDVQLF